MKSIRILLSAILMFTCFSAFCQQISRFVIGTSGCTGQSCSASLCWTMGDLCTKSLTASNSMLTEGFQQGKLLFTNIADNQNMEGAEINIYPNPAGDVLMVNNEKERIEKLWIIDMKGHILQEAAPEQRTFSMEISAIAPGSYILLYRMQSGRKMEAIRFEKIND